MKNTNPVVTIIGGGPAGIAAAIQLKRYNIDAILFEGEELGGLLKNAYIVENYPGFPGGIPGGELVKRFKTHLETYRVNVKYEWVKQLEFVQTGKKEKFRLTTCTSTYYADVVVAASGTGPKKPALLEALSPAFRKNIFYEVYPVKHVKGKRVVIIGGGDAAFDYALHLSGRNEIVILNRKSRIKALPLLVDRAKKNEGIQYFDNCRVLNIESGNEKRLLVTYVKEKSDKKIESDYVLCAIGREPQVDFFTESIMEIKEELLNRGRIYFAGDVKNGNYRQAAIAVGNGMESAMKIYKRVGEIK
ncbi:MAG: NAD(P)/FAD-dependent oxidoreductase [Candidatus Aminicenantes bacterium]|nr:NAD(P)/FAD-dependent oxidoreductase [Candidatus Aminicenantes bacterium]